jgi:hypothetical protein
MFSKAIEEAAGYTRPYAYDHPDLPWKQGHSRFSTLFFVNEEGYAVTCKHVADTIAPSDNMNKQFQQFKKERESIPKGGKAKQALTGLELKYKYKPESIVQIKNNFLDCVDKPSGFTMHTHPEYDLAIVKFNDFSRILYTGYAKFLKDSSKARQGIFLCRLGFPFPEFTNFAYNEKTDDIEWSSTGIQATPRFPIEGMITRFLANEKRMYGIEMSTPGLEGTKWRASF